MPETYTETPTAGLRQGSEQGRAQGQKPVHARVESRLVAVGMKIKNLRNVGKWN